MQNLVPHFILERYALGEYGGRFSTVSLFADISGFSTVTSSLMQYGNEAAEAMADVMKAIFEPLVDHVYTQGGFIIRFAGDAFTALFPKGSDQQSDPDLGPASYQRALAAAVAIQQHMAEHPTQTTPYRSFPFAIKLGLSDGEVEWGILQPDQGPTVDGVKAAYFFSGPAIDGAAAAEHRAQPGEIILSASVHEVLAPLVTAEPVDPSTLPRIAQHNAQEGGVFLRVTAVPGPLPDPPALGGDRQPDSTDNRYTDLVAAFLPESIIQQCSRRHWRGEFRQVLVLFVNLMSIDTSEQLARFIESVFALQRQYGGYLNQIDFGDKGCNLLMFWGTPTSFENDIERALNFILDIPEITPGTFRAGITYRPMYAGLDGSLTRGEFSCHGLGINLAARLMTTAPWGEIWLDEEVARRAAHLFDVELEGEFTFKGFAKEQPVYVLLERKAERTAELFQGALVGRQAELAQLAEFIQPLSAPEGENRFAGILVVQGEAGLGKTRLVHEFLARLKQALASSLSPWPNSQSPIPQPFLCQTDQILRYSLNPFRYWLQHYFEQSAAQSESRNKRAFRRKLDRLIAVTPDPALGQELNRTRSCLGALVDLSWESSLYTQLDPKGRFENTLMALKALIKAESRQRPVLIRLEDAQWLDEDSIRFVQRLVRNVDDYPFALIATARPVTGPLFGKDVPYRQIDLVTLSATDVGQLAEEILGVPAGPALIDLLAQRAEGNPFFAEQILLYLREQELLDRGELLDASASAIPTDVRAVLIARLDRLTRKVREIVQTAAVLGREFEVEVLSQILLGNRLLDERIATAEKEAIWIALSQLRYLFKHALLRDTAYGMQLRARRRELHQLAAEALETLYANDLPPHYGEIAHHYEAACQLGEKETQTNARSYLQKAGRRAAEAYENTTAADYYSRALALTPAAAVSARYDLLLAREQVYDALGARPAQAEDLASLVELVQDDSQKRATVSLRWAHYARVTGDYPQSIDQARAAIRTVQEAAGVGPTDQELAQLEAAGYLEWGRALRYQGAYENAQVQLGQALTLARNRQLPETEANSLLNLGIVSRYRSQYAEAITYFEQSLRIARELEDRRNEGMSLDNLGTVLSHQGRHSEAHTYFEQALAIFAQIGNRWSQGIVLNNLGSHHDQQGDYTAAGSYYQQALDICREIDDREGEGIARANLGLLSLYQGDYAAAQDYLESGLQVCRTIGDRWAEGFILGNLGLLFHQLGDLAAARAHCQQAQAVAQDLGDRHLLGYALTNLGHALAGLGQPAEAGEAYGQALELRRELGQHNLAMESLAGLARVVLAQGNLDQALARTEEMLRFLERDTLDGTDQPLWVYLTCYQVLQANQDPRTRTLLSRAYQQLQERADKIADVAMRRSFLENVAAHREIVAIGCHLPVRPDGADAPAGSTVVDGPPA